MLCVRRDGAWHVGWISPRVSARQARGVIRCNRVDMRCADGGVAQTGALPQRHETGGAWVLGGQARRPPQP